MPGDLKICYFVDSGSEANDLRLLMGALTAETTMSSRFKTHTATTQLGWNSRGNRTWKFNVPHSFRVRHVIVPDPYPEHGHATIRTQDIITRPTSEA